MKTRIFHTIIYVKYPRYYLLYINILNPITVSIFSLKLEPSENIQIEDQVIGNQ